MKTVAAGLGNSGRWGLRGLRGPASRAAGAAGTAFALLCAGLASAPPARAITNATPTSAFAAVGFFGVQVAPDWVLTAQHVAAAFLPTGPGTIDFGNGLGARTVVARYDAPGTAGFPANDLTLLRLAPGSGSGAAPFLPLAADLPASGSFAPLAATMATSSGALQRAYAWTTVDGFAEFIDPDDDGPLPPVRVNYWLSRDAVTYVTSGDSGGALFWGHVGDAVTPLLGIASAQLGPEGGPPTGSAFVAPAAYRGWLDATLAAAPGNVQQLVWVSVVPEPGALLLWALGLGAVAGAARRARR